MIPKCVIITGASTGLGLELAKEFYARGIRVVGISRTKPLLPIEYIKADLSKEQNIDKVVKIIKKKYPVFDCLINCAGITTIEQFGEMNYKTVERIFKVNVLAPLLLTSGLIDIIKKNEADIVNIGSTLGFKAYEKYCAYGTSKWAVQGINESLQLHLKDSKSRVIGFNSGRFMSKLYEHAGVARSTSCTYMNPRELAKLMIVILKLPKEMEVSKIIINCKGKPEHV